MSNQQKIDDLRSAGYVVLTQTSNSPHLAVSGHA